MSDVESIAGDIRALLGRRLHHRSDVSQHVLTDVQYRAFREMQLAAFAFGSDFLAHGVRRELAKDRYLDVCLRFVATFAEPKKRRPLPKGKR